MRPETLEKLKALKVEPPDDDEIPPGLEIDEAIAMALRICEKASSAAGALNRAGYRSQLDKPFTMSALLKAKRRLRL